LTKREGLTGLTDFIKEEAFPEPIEEIGGTAS
jgi:hypothetical protein